MSDLFKGYERDYTKYIAAANKKISGLAAAGNSDHLVADARNDLEQAEKALKLMEHELATMPPQLSSQFQPRVKRHNDNLKSLKQSLSSEKDRQQKKQLVGQGGGYDPREKLLTANEIVQDSGDTLERTLRLGLETEQVAGDTMNNLKTQRQQIHRINDKVNDVGTNLTKANKVITTMDRRRLWMKCIMIIIIMLLILAIGILCFVKFG